MVFIPGGKFLMGCQGKQRWRCGLNEKPIHIVEIDPYFLDIHEVTVEEYWECVDAGICHEPEWQSLDGNVNIPANNKESGLSNHPVNYVNWHDAAKYCQWKGRRLPTEAEFEFALRGGHEGFTFPWGEELPIPYKAGNYMDNSCLEKYPFKPDESRDVHYNDGFPATSPVCSFEKNPYGLCDISGNVSEWCMDYYDGRFYETQAMAVNPVNRKAAEHVVVRGCDWHHEAGVSIRITKRSHYPPDFRHFYIGFRCAKDR
jgi:formylglycine-generating enzyme required for sulfatase activity